MFGRTGPEPAVNGMIFWSGSAFGLEDQVLLPIVADNELRGLTYPKAVAVDSVLARLRTIPEYRERFAAAFPDVVAIFGDDPLRVISAVTLRRALAGYLRELFAKDPAIDTLVLGCTHYPLLRDVITRVAAELTGRPVAVVDSATAMAEAAREALGTSANRRNGPGRLDCFATDISRLAEIAPRFLGEPLTGFELVDL